MITDTKILHTAITDELYRKASSMRYPLSGTFELSPICNFDCKMCYVRKSKKEVLESKRKALCFDDFMALAKSARENGTLFILLTGGEPLLWEHFWELYDELVKMGFLVSINTNGSLIDEKAVEHFKKLPPRQINITLYGASDETYNSLCCVRGAFEKVSRAIDMLLEAEINVKLNCSLTPSNVSDLNKMIEYAQKRGLTLDATAYMLPPIRKDLAYVGKNEERFSPEDAAFYRMLIYKKQNSKERYDRFLRDIRDGYTEPLGLDEGCIDPVDGQIRCRAGKATFWITWDGYMTPCGMMPEPKADLTEMDFERAWAETVEACDRMKLSGLCERCSNRRICHPCAAMAFAETGRADGIPQYLCRLSKRMQELATKELEENYLE